MSTTGNEYEQPGVNYPDREDAGGAEATPGTGEPTRDETPSSPDELAGGEPVGGEPADDATERNEAAGDPPAEDAPAPPADDPSHVATGVGVVGVDEGADHHGQDGGRETVSAGEAQRTSGALGTEQEQRLPAMAQNDASSLEKVTGIVAQTRADVGIEPVERIAEVLHQRLEQAGVDLPDDDITELARQISTGDAKSPTES